MIYAAILAGGRGTRMGGECPKQYMELCGEPIMIHTLREFAQSGLVDECVVCVPLDYIDFTRELISKYSELCRISVIEGGADRTGSLENACKFFSERHMISDNDVIVTHDCVRPFADRAIISAGIDAARKYGGATAAVPSVDTICVTSDGITIDNVPDRATLYSVQTPQTFMMKKFCELLYSLSDEEREKITDASAVYRLRGETVAISQGSPSNIKITHPDDIAVAESILRKREKCGE